MNRLLTFLFFLFTLNTANAAEVWLVTAGYSENSTKSFTSSAAACSFVMSASSGVDAPADSTCIASGTTLQLVRQNNTSYVYRAVGRRDADVENECSNAPGVQNQYGSGASFINLSWAQGSAIPSKTCIPHAGGFCPFVISGSSQYINIGSSTTAIAYSASVMPVSQCSNQTDNACDPKDPYGKCYSPPNDGCTRQSNGSIVCPPSVPPPSPQPTCKYSTSGAYCTPQNGQCPSGYVTGNYNGQTICVKDSKNPPPTDPNNQQGDGACNGTGNCSPNSNNTTTNNHTTNNTTNNNTTNTTNNTTNNNTTEVTQKLDDSGIIAAINSTSASIVQTITSKSEAIKTAVDAVKNTADSILDKLGIVDKSIKDAAQQAKSDAKTQLDETKKYGEQAKTDAKKHLDQDKAYQDWQKLTQKCAGATPPVTRDSFSNTNEANDFVNNTTTPSGNPSDVNMKLCKFADSFEEYQNWMKGTGEEKFEEVDTDFIFNNVSIPGLETNTLNYGQQCPQDKVLTLPGFGRQSFSYTLKLSDWCNALILLGKLIVVLAYLHAGMIVLSASRN